MAADTLFGETILWSGRPRVHRVPNVYRAVTLVSVVVAVVSLAFAIVARLALGSAVGGMVALSAWSAILAVGSWRLPLVWWSEVEYLVTERHVIWRRGRLRRIIDRDAISYARVRWSPKLDGVGDLVLVRAVPTGALRRTLSLTLADVEAPDRLWATVRGTPSSRPFLGRRLPLAQRLDDDERVVWTAVPRASRWTTRRTGNALLAVALAACAVRSIVKVVPGLLKLSRIHLLSPSLLALLAVACGLGTLLLLGVAVGVADRAWLRPLRMIKRTRYFITNKRVLIVRGDEELHLDRQRIAYVIPTTRASRRAGRAGNQRLLHDVFLVLDGPQARALAVMGAFGEGHDAHLLPIFSAIEDADVVHELLHPPAELPRAA